ncbi:hypothetical protein DICVIV_08657 [Dictyocaulus viviparus]|uniref:Uncharacterized protein n=1 Tax=Dictyocaulus viviparus TaxID=29172 RepID=A0A0D8XSD7_DICVI|nr:hypothetical protein DICVIV_08657 [Dictyocaulus viviparus]
MAEKWLLDYTLEDAIVDEHAREPADITEITQLYSSTRKTKATVAREMGLEEVAQGMLSGKTFNLSQLVGSRKELNNLETVEINIRNLMADLMNRMPETLDTVKAIAGMETKVHLSVQCGLSNKAKKWTLSDSSYRLISNFNDYVDFKKDVRRIENYQILAMQRGEECDVLTWKIDVACTEKEHPGHGLRIAPSHRDLFQAALKDSLSRFFIPKIQRTIRRSLISRAEEAAISYFALNLRHLFWREGVNSAFVIALDPGFSACKAAFLAPTVQINCIHCRFGK